jgi:PD-(D/E)XK nuclease superfamily
MRQVSQRYVDALFNLVKQKSVALSNLSDHWPEVEKQILKKRLKLSKRIAKGDPIRAPVDLLSPLKRATDETIHTRALAYLLNPLEEHGFGKDVLSAVLAKLSRSRAVAPVTTLLQKRIRIDVFSEYHYSTRDSSVRSVARNDIRIELQGDNSAALIIVENKIGAPDGKGQLEDYEAEAREWCKRNRARPLLVYLALDKDEGTRRVNWLNLTYLDLASALRQVWQRRRSAPGRSWLGLYISAITTGVLGINVNRLRDTTIDEIDGYLGGGR